MSEMIKIAACASVGNSRENHEDNFIISKGVFLSKEQVDKLSAERTLITAEQTHSPQQPLLLAVSDGMGGHACGEEASLLTVNYLSDCYDEIISSSWQEDEALTLHIANINKVVCDAAKADNSYFGMGATLCGVIIKDEKLTAFNVGDSRLYRYYDGILEQLTTDHTEGQRLLNMNLLTQEQEKNFPRRKLLHRYIGYDGNLAADISSCGNIESGSMLMICTDGLSDVLDSSEIIEILNSDITLCEQAERLVEKAQSKNAGYGDNITVVLVGF